MRFAAKRGESIESRKKESPIPCSRIQNGVARRSYRPFSKVLRKLVRSEVRPTFLPVANHQFLIAFGCNNCSAEGAMKVEKNLSIGTYGSDSEQVGWSAYGAAARDVP